MRGRNEDRLIHRGSLDYTENPEALWTLEGKGAAPAAHRIAA
jgi:hypothetical protein